MTVDRRLRDQLVRAYHGGDRRKFAELCRRHAEAIVDQFDDWAVAPAEIRHDQRALAGYVQALAAVAKALEGLGYPAPMRRLMPPGAANPIARWTFAYNRAVQLDGTGEYDAAAEQLAALLTEMQGTTGPEDIRTKAVGLLGTTALRRGRIDDALRYTEEALRRCRAAGDLEGVWIYTENLDTLLVAKEIAAGTAAGTELAHVRGRLAFAQDLSDSRRYPASNEVLHELCDAVAETAGVRYLGKIHGLLGLNYFRLGEVAAAERCTRRALAECRFRHDHAGERIYAANLAEITRRR